MKNDIHLFAIDLTGDPWREHEPSIACWCVPTLEKVEGEATAYFVVHHVRGTTTTFSRALEIQDDSGTANIANG